MSKPDFFSFVGYINFIKQDDKFAYAACPLPDVNTKVVPVNGGWWCEKTQRTFPNCDWRYILSFTVADHTSQTWVSTFNDVGKKIMGIDANQLKELVNGGESTHDYFDRVQWQLFNFKVRAKTETYQNEPRVKVTVLEAEPVR
jgi:replication factor A1